MTASRTLSNAALAMMSLPVMLGAALCYLRPEGARAWAVGMLLLPSSRLCIKAAGTALGKTTVCTTAKRAETGDVRKQISYAMIFASLVLCVSMGAPLATALRLVLPLRMARPIGMAVIVAGVFAPSIIMFSKLRQPRAR
jgi:hypothetical protein